MRRTFRLRVSFAPTRLAAEPLRVAYELVVPVERTPRLRKVVPREGAKAQEPSPPVKKEQDAS